MTDEQLYAEFSDPPVCGPLDVFSQLFGFSDWLVDKVLEVINQQSLEWLRENQERVVAQALRAFDDFIVPLDIPFIGEAEEVSIEALVRTQIERNLRSFIAYVLS